MNATYLTRRVGNWAVKLLIMSLPRGALAQMIVWSEVKSYLEIIEDLFKVTRMGGVGGKDFNLYFCMAKRSSGKSNLRMKTMLLPAAMHESVKKIQKHKQWDDA